MGGLWEEGAKDLLGGSWKVLGRLELSFPVVLALFWAGLARFDGSDVFVQQLMKKLYFVHPPL